MDLSPTTSGTTRPSLKYTARSTSDVGRLTGYSTQQVRDLERLGVIPAARRAHNGYRQYADEHVAALVAYRGLAAAIGPVRARQLMPLLLDGTLGDAASVIDNIHAEIARERAVVVRARLDLALIASETTDSFDARRDSMTITELAHALDVPTSTLRHWESEGLVRPERVGTARVRHFGWRAIIDARIIAALRAGGHRVPTIADVLDRVRDLAGVDGADDLLSARLHALAARSLALLETAGHLHALIQARPDR